MAAQLSAFATTTPDNPATTSSSSSGMKGGGSRKRGRGGGGGVAFVFTGQGAQWEGMGNELMEGFPVYRRAVR